MFEVKIKSTDHNSFSVMGKATRCDMNGSIHPLNAYTYITGQKSEQETCKTVPLNAAWRQKLR